MTTSAVRSVLLAVVATAVLPLAAAPQAPPAWPPARLRETGLYADWPTRTIAPANLPFSPQYPLWTDGAKKSRWLYLPPGTFIDGSNPDVWQFPVGTRLWKEFRFGRRAETRFIEHTAAGWQFASYVWNDDETEAPLAPERGVRYSVEIRDGIRHSIPSRTDCLACHEAGPVRVLGFTALQLSPDRDPLAPHAEPPPPGAVDLPGLVARGLLRGLPERLAVTPPRIVARTPVSRAALGYLNGNCGGCHTGLGDLSSLELALNYIVDTPPGAVVPAVRTTLGHRSHFEVPGAPDVVDRVSAGRPDDSVLVRRMASRNPLLQMPPLGTKTVDEEALALIRRWILEDLGSAEPSGGTGKVTSDHPR